jgi:hypothetical protein
MARGGIIRRSNVSKRMGHLAGLVVKFMKEVDPVAKKMLLPGGVLAKINWEDPDDKTIVLLRQMLSWEIKEGMLKRQDQEIEIAIMAILVWFTRMEKERRDEILQSWG